MPEPSPILSDEKCSQRLQVTRLEAGEALTELTHPVVSVVIGIKCCVVLGRVADETDEIVGFEGFVSSV